MTQPTGPAPTDPTDEPARDPGNTDPSELVAPLDPDDDVHERIALINRQQPEALQRGDQPS